MQLMKKKNEFAHKRVYYIYILYNAREEKKKVGKWVFSRRYESGHQACVCSTTSTGCDIEREEN